MQFLLLTITVDDVEPKDDNSDSSPPLPTRLIQVERDQLLRNGTSGTVVLRLEMTLQRLKPLTWALPTADLLLLGTTAFTRGAPDIAAWEADLLLFTSRRSASTPREPGGGGSGARGEETCLAVANDLSSSGWTCRWACPSSRAGREHRVALPDMTRLAVAGNTGPAGREHRRLGDRERHRPIRRANAPGRVGSRRGHRSKAHAKTNRGGINPRPLQPRRPADGSVGRGWTFLAWSTEAHPGVREDNSP